MDNKKRQLLKAITATATLLPLSKLSIASESLNPKDVTFLSTSSKKDGKYYLNGLNIAGQSLFAKVLPGRAHGITLHPQGLDAVIVARRPGDFMLVFNKASGDNIATITTKDNRHFYGHAIYSADGRWLYTSENDLDTRQGVISVRDSLHNYQLVDEFASYGIGPHEMAMLSDQQTLVVANGGILTHPETGRSKLNLDTMSPSLAYINNQNGKLVESVKLEKKLHQNSIRHLAISPQDDVCFVMQFEGNASVSPPLIGLHQTGKSVTLLSAPSEIHTAMANYCGSVQLDQSGTIAAVSSPRGNIITFWSIKDKNYLSYTHIDDGCGVTASGKANEFILTSGKGGVYQYNALTQQRLTLINSKEDEYRWDNHISGVRRS